MPSVVACRALDGAHLGDVLACLVHEKVDRVTRMVPQQVVCPASLAAVRACVLAPEEIGLHVHLLDGQLARPYPPVHKLVRGVEPPHMAGHGDEPGFPLLRDKGLRVRKAVGHRDLDENMFAGVHRGKPLFGVEARGRCQNDRVNIVHGKALAKLGGVVRYAVQRREFGCRRRASADKRDNLDVVDELYGVEMLFSKGAAAGKAYVHCRVFPIALGVVFLVAPGVAFVWLFHTTQGIYIIMGFVGVILSQLVEIINLIRSLCNS